MIHVEFPTAKPAPEVPQMVKCLAASVIPDINLKTEHAQAVGLVVTHVISTLHQMPSNAPNALPDSPTIPTKSLTKLAHPVPVNVLHVNIKLLIQPK